MAERSQPSPVCETFLYRASIGYPVCVYSRAITMAINTTSVHYELRAVNKLIGLATLLADTQVTGQLTQVVAV